MAIPRTSVRSFLATAKSTLQNAAHSSTPVTLVVGNESADLDSLCSAVVVAYLRSQPPSSTFHIPLSNLPAADLALRTELLPVLSHANLRPADLITLSDLPTTPLKPELTRWLLVDHNALQGDLGKLYGERVVGCIDHHDEEGRVPRDTKPEPRIVEKSGSCSSLVVEYCKEAWSSLSTSDTKAEQLDVEIAKLALAPILVDTVNLTAEAKVTPADTAAVKYLEDVITKFDTAYERDVFYEEINKAKLDIGGLSIYDILRKDYKQWTEGDMALGICAVVQDIEFLLEKAATEKNSNGAENMTKQQYFFETVKKFAADRSLSICAIMTTSNTPSGEFRRELLVWALDPKGAEAAQRFDKLASGELQLETWGNEELGSNTQSDWRRCWWQRKLEDSRKQVAPLLRKAMGT